MRIYATIIEHGKEAIEREAEELYDKYHQAAEDDVLDYKICIAILRLYPIAWPTIAKLSKARNLEKDEAQQILKSLK